MITRSKDVELDCNVNFSDLKLSPRTIQGLKQCGFERPSPIQLETIPLGRCGFDLVVQSKAGTGKTFVFAVIALEALQFNPNNFTQTLVLAPTREIAIQIHEVISAIGSHFEVLQVALCIGGVEVKADRARLSSFKDKNGTSQIVVGTPGRIKQLIELNILKTQHIEILVLDEADKLIDEQFKSQTDEIFKRLPEDKQMIVTSATYPNELAQFLQLYMKKPKSIRLGKDLSLDAVQELYVESPAGHSNKKTLEIKLETLRRLLDQFDSYKCFIFTNFQARAPQICDKLNEDEKFVEKHGSTTFMSAELSQEERNSVFMSFRNSSQKLLVSTDVSARGIDIRDIDLVINFDLPLDNSTYYHRIGRAGRFGLPGTAVSIVSQEAIDRSVFERKVKSDRMTILKLDN